ncbi:transcription factor bHLH35-like isoform X2 [Actinidia eriantha]|uniref:transcription factor bHLH35-like isoform X2 n=1 Tax=Actinidia eriantha TaxID=165200 RepID=UPI0025844897|nr:transcription factor bHLH35-like isoform X2 [Actinidia eriantha]
MENIGEEYKHYWETNMFLQTEELDSWGLDEAFNSGYYDSSSPDGAQSSAASKNIVSERNRRKKLNERLFALRAVVPKISKLSVSYVGEKTVVVSLTCNKRTNTMVKLCEVFETLKLKIIAANISAFSGRLLKTVFLQADEEEKDLLKIKIETAIAALNDPESPMSM